MSRSRLVVFIMAVVLVGLAALGILALEPPGHGGTLARGGLSCQRRPLRGQPT
jgi:hypothetical protein